MNQTPGQLFVVATPIGNLEDLSARARRVLEEVAVIAAEDTRRTRQLLSSFRCHTPLMAVHEHNEAERVPVLCERLAAGEDVALVSDAGTPLISDPGFALVQACQRRGIRVVPVPGPSALLAALQASGLPTDRFVFEGFLPRKAGQRRERLAALVSEPRTLVFFESVHRIADTVGDLAASFGAERPATLARELTKMHESVVSDSLGGLAAALREGSIVRRGEFVLVVAGHAAEQSGGLAEARRVYGLLIEVLPADAALKLTARITGVKRNALYAALRA
jgi:16S rRNA (cytidine1402-2'-O)-methyltransferase